MLHPDLQLIKALFPSFNWKDGTVFFNQANCITCETDVYLLTIHAEVLSEDGTHYELLVLATAKNGIVDYEQRHDRETIKKYLQSVMILGI